VRAPPMGDEDALRLRAERGHFEFYGEWFDDESLSNGVFQAFNAVGRALPAAVSTVARVASRGLAGRTKFTEGSGDLVARHRSTTTSGPTRPALPHSAPEKGLGQPTYGISTNPADRP
jgi:hypothetical protein